MRKFISLSEQVQTLIWCKNAFGVAQICRQVRMED